MGRNQAYSLKSKRADVKGCAMNNIRQTSSQLFEKGLELANEGRHIEAIQALETALRIKPDSAEIRYGLGLIYLLSGDKDAARKEYERVKSLDRDLGDKLAKHF